MSRPHFITLLLLLICSLGFSLYPNIALALQEIRLEPGSTITITPGSETQVSCVGTKVQDLPVCKITPSGDGYVIWSNTTIAGHTSTLLEAAEVIEKMSAGHLCR